LKTKEKLKSLWNNLKDKGILETSPFYLLSVSVAVLFDWIYMPWLAVKFPYLAVVPLYFSLFSISIIGILVVKCSKRDVLMVGAMDRWLNRDSSVEILLKIEGRIKRSMFAQRFNFKWVCFVVNPIRNIFLFLFKEFVSVVNLLKRKAIKNPKLKFVLISIWWGPLHSFLFFEKEFGMSVKSVLKSFLEGSFYCAVFWGLVIDVLVVLWNIIVHLI